MDAGSVQEIAKRLESWCVRNDRGLARVEWDSAYARSHVVDRLKDTLGKAGTKLVEIELPPGESGEKVVAGLLETLGNSSGSVASITGIEWAFPEHGQKLDTLAALSFQRELLASFSVRQIWWIPSTLTEKFILGVPDLDSWFQLRLHLTEIPPPTPEIGGEVQLDRKVVSVAEARAAARHFWERIDAARAQGNAEERIWQELGQPAIDALTSAGLAQEAEAIAMRAPDIETRLERVIRELDPADDSENREVFTLKRGLARIRNDRGDFAGARHLQEGLLKLLKRVQGDYDPDTLKLMTELADTLVAQGDLTAARQLEERAVEATAGLFGEEHPFTLASRNNLASTMRAQGDLAMARQFQERVLETRMRLFGEENSDSLASMNNLALTLWQQGDLAGARRLQERVLEISRRVLGQRYPTTLRAMNNLGLTLKALGDFTGAATIEKEALEGNTRILGEEHPDTLGSSGNLALTLRAQGDLAGARLLQERALEVSRRALGENHPATLRAMASLAQTLDDLGETDAAQQLQERMPPVTTDK